MAYVLGFFAADGNMVKNRRGACFISIEITDRDILEKIKLALGSNHKISARNGFGRLKESYRLQIGSKEMFNDLLKLGLTPAKSIKIDLPNVPDLYFAHFVRGYFDGDGNILSGYFKRNDRRTKRVYALRVCFTSGSKKILDALKIRLCGLLRTSGSINGSDNIWRLNYSTNDTKKLYSFLYPSTDNLLYLERKYNIFKHAVVVQPG